MRSVLMAIFLLLLILIFCLWSACMAESITANLLSIARSAHTDSQISILNDAWSQHRIFLYLTINRKTLAEAERALTKMQAHAPDSQLFQQGKTDFIQIIQNMQNNYKVTFFAVL